MSYHNLHIEVFALLREDGNNAPKIPQDLTSIYQQDLVGEMWDESGGSRSTEAKHNVVLKKVDGVIQDLTALEGSWEMTTKHCHDGF